MGLHIHIHHHTDDKGEKSIIKFLKEIMANIQELQAKVDALQASLDAEQEQVAAAIAALQQSIIDLQAIVADGGTAEERQALADKLDEIKSDLESTVAP